MSSRPLMSDALYDRAAQEAGDRVIARYSTSFSAACMLLGPRVRPHVRAIYALVRVADEVVDGPGRVAHPDPQSLADVLDALEAETLRALETGYSTNLIVHGFARTARECGIRAALIEPFFASMRADIPGLTEPTRGVEAHAKYVYGSAEVVGLMCLQVFTNAGTGRITTPAAHLIAGARRLGAAFQEINFLRDLHTDQSELGRDYLEMSTPADRRRLLERIDADLRAAARTLPDLPTDCRRGVRAAHDLFAALVQRLRADPDGRASVPTVRKAAILVNAFLPLPRSGGRS